MPGGVFSPGHIVTIPSELPPHTRVRIVRLRGKGQKVAANLAPSDGEVMNAHGDVVRFRAGRDYIVERNTGHREIVPRNIFERTFRRRGPQAWRENNDIRYRAAIAPCQVHVATLDGVKTARADDWIMIGVANEMWVEPADTAARKYKSVPAVGVTGVVTTVALVFALLAFVTWYAS